MKDLPLGIDYMQLLLLMLYGWPEPSGLGSPLLGQLTAHLFNVASFLSLTGLFSRQLQEAREQMIQCKYKV